MVSNQNLHIGFLSLLDSQNSNGAKYGKYCGCDTSFWQKIREKQYKKMNGFGTNQELTRLTHKIFFRIRLSQIISTSSLIVNQKG